MNILKKLGIVLLSGSILAGMPACTNLDEEIFAQSTDENFPSTPEEYAALTGPVYVAAQTFFDVNYYDLQQTGTDEAVVPTRGGDWFDGGRWRTMHFHEWTPSLDLLGNSWDWGFNAIGTCNQVLEMLEEAPESENKNQTIAEVKTMRAWYYYCMMDAFGNIPLVTSYDASAAAPSNTPRAEIFQFIADELETNLPLLTEEVSAVTYGRPTQYMAHALLAKLYLNAGTYTGNLSSQHLEKVISNSNSIINSGKYSLGNYFAQFMPTNGPSDPEPIFSIPFDAVRAQGNLLFNKTLHYGHRQTYNLTANPWNGWTTTPDFFDSYDDEDIRKEQWLYGVQYNRAGEPLVYNNIEVVLDPYYFPDFNLGGGDDEGRLAGARNVKYYPDENAVQNHANNDFVMFRLADVMLMKAEAILRSGGSAADAVEAIRPLQERAFPANPEKQYTAATLTLEAIYNERGRELAMEMTRRTDMIRFRTWNDEILFKPARPNADYLELFPIPARAIAANPNLEQNPGYTN